MNIYGFTIKKLEDYFKVIDENPAKAKIVFRAVYRDKINSFKEIENLGDAVKGKLGNDFNFSKIQLVTTSESVDTCKYLFKLADGCTVETVLMKHDYGNGVCVSTQVGCNMDCVFCESGKLKKVRNLETYEIVQQLWYIIDTLNIPVSHVVLMGIGEPFDNYDNVVDFIDIITEQLGIGIASRHVTVSTSGIAPKIREYAKREVVNSLAISLHAPSNDLRNRLMPINKAYPIEELVDAVREYEANGNKKVTFAYIMLKDINDSDECAHQLAQLLDGMHCYVNLIPYNKTRSTEFESSSKERIAQFFDILKKYGLNVTVRREFGGNMNAACGQLSSDYRKSCYTASDITKEM